MKQQEVKKELKMKASKAGGKVTPVNGMNYFGSIFRIARNFMLNSMVILRLKIKTFFLIW